MSFLSVEQAVTGRHVLYAGKDPDASDVLSAELRARDHVLMPHHPGLINSFVGPGLTHCLVDFFGLEQEPISFAVGFDHDEEGFYRGLIDPTPEEWQIAASTGWWADSNVG